MLLDENNNPRTWEAPNLKSTKILSHSLLKLWISLIYLKPVKNLLRVVLNYCMYFKMIWSLIRFEQMNKLNQYQDHDGSCCSSKNDDRIIVKSSNLKDQVLSIVIIYYFITHKNKGVVLSLYGLIERLVTYNSFRRFSKTRLLSSVRLYYKKHVFYRKKKKITMMYQDSSGMKYQGHIFNIHHILR